MTISLKDKNILKLLGLESIPIDQQVELVGRAAELLDSRVFERVLEVLPKEHHEEAVDILGGDGDKATDTFFEKHNIDFYHMAQEEAEKIKHELLQVAEEIKA